MDFDDQKIARARIASVNDPAARTPLDISPLPLLHSRSRGRGEAGYRAGLSSRRPRVQVPSLPLFFQWGMHERSLRSHDARILCARGARTARAAISSFQRAVAQLVARSVRDRKAGGSNPPSPKSRYMSGSCFPPFGHGVIIAWQEASFWCYNVYGYSISWKNDGGAFVPSD